MTQTKQEQLKALKKIRRSALSASRGFGPAASPALLGASFGGMAGYGLGYLAQSGWMLAAGLFLVGGFVGFRIAKYKSWGEYIYVLLAAYHPADKIAYAALQKQAAERSLSFGEVIAWTAIEKESLCPSSQSKADQAQEVFTSKTLR